MTNCAWDIYSDILVGNQYGPISLQNQEKCPQTRYFLLIIPYLNVQESRIVPCVKKNDNLPFHKDCCDRTCRGQHSVTVKDTKFLGNDWLCMKSNFLFHLQMAWSYSTCSLLSAGEWNAGYFIVVLFLPAFSSFQCRN